MRHTDLLNSSELEREYDEIIRKQRDQTKDGDLRSSLCALIFLIGKLPRTPGADDGVRAKAETLVDLLVSDLGHDRPRLEQQVPRLLKQLVDSGQVMAVESEFRLRTREGARWTHDFNRRRTAALNDDERINTKRSELLREGVHQALRPVSLQQGASHQPRKITAELSASRPATSKDEVALWLRDGWNDDEGSVLNDARAAGVNGQPIQATALPQNQVGVASFYVDVPPLTVQQRLELKALFQKLGITTGRTLLADPDPVPDLTKQLTTALRTTLGALQAATGITAPPMKSGSRFSKTASKSATPAC